MDTGLAAVLLLVFVLGTTAWGMDGEPVGAGMVEAVEDVIIQAETADHEDAGPEGETLTEPLPVPAEAGGAGASGGTEAANDAEISVPEESGGEYIAEEIPMDEREAADTTETSDAEYLAEEFRTDGTPKSPDVEENPETEQESGETNPGDAETADFTLDLETGNQNPSGGSTILYEVRLTNTGTLPLTNIALESSFSCPRVVQSWEAESGLAVEDAGSAILSSLQPGEVRSLYLTAQLSEEQSGTLTHTVTARGIAPDEGQENIIREASVSVEAEPLTADFTVEKSADRAQALIGDVVTYWICIRNTGERTLHSVVSTERFVGADVEAQFAEQAGVTLNENATQALISQILPGEAVNLKATVVIPQEAAGQELVNEVTVVTAETGERTVQAQASVAVNGLQETEEPEEEPEPAAEIPLEESGKGNPKTGDPQNAAPYLLSLAAAALAAAGVFCRGKGKRKH